MNQNTVLLLPSRQFVLLNQNNFPPNPVCKMTTNQKLETTFTFQVTVMFGLLLLRLFVIFGNFGAFRPFGTFKTFLHFGHLRHLEQFSAITTVILMFKSGI